MQSIITLLCFYGICFAAQNAKLFNTPRNWLCEKSHFIYDLLSCSFCTGAWAGLVTYLLFNLPSGVFVWNMAIAYFFAGAAWCYLCDLISDCLEGLVQYFISKGSDE